MCVSRLRSVRGSRAPRSCGAPPSSEPVKTRGAPRTRLGLAYQDDCLELGLTWRREFVTTGDAKKGDIFEVRFALRNLGFR